jgi:beta-galactosidase
MHRTEAAIWAEVLDVEDAEVLAWYSSGWYANEAAITHRRHQQGGRVIYVGCMGGPELYDNLFGWLLPQLKVQPLLSPVAGVEVAEREGENGKRVVFVLNHSSQPRSISLAQPVVDLLTGNAHERSLSLRPRQVVVFVAPVGE